MKQRHKQIRPEMECAYQMCQLCVLYVRRTSMQGMRWTCGTYSLQMELSTLQLTKAVVRFGLMSGANFDCTKARLNAMMTAEGSVRDPPRQVVCDCNKEVDEILRQILLPFIYAGSFLIKG
ncbi:hypothetical protein Ac2012v2_002441 [Leucoagaricus gongylophorus]